MIRKLLTLPALLPLGALYAVSDVAAFVLRRVVRYRRSTVRDNLAKCFPDMSQKEMRQIERRFYRNFADNFVETLKLLHISDKEMMRRTEFVNTGLIDRLLDEGRSIVVYFAHTFNWEWAPSVGLHTARRPGGDVHFGQIYRPLKSESFDRLMLHIRSRFGSESYPKSTALRSLLRIRRDGCLSITGFMSDQHPGHGDPGYLTTLLGRPTLMITGTETLARKLDMAVVYWDMEHVARGHYRITTRLIAENCRDLPEGAVTERYTRMLEETIRRDPSIWLWSHKRWKYPVKPATETNVTNHR